MRGDDATSLLEKFRFVRLSPGNSRESESESIENNAENKCIWWPCLLYSNYSDLLSSITSRKLKILLSSERFKHHRNSTHYSVTNKVAMIVGKRAVNDNRRMKFISKEDESDIIKDFFENEGQMEELYDCNKDWCDAFAEAHQIMDRALSEEGGMIEYGEEVGIVTNGVHITVDDRRSPAQTKSYLSQPTDSVPNEAHADIKNDAKKSTSHKGGFVVGKSNEGKEVQNSPSESNHLRLDQRSQPIEPTLDDKNRLEADTEQTKVPTKKIVENTSSKIQPSSDMGERILNHQVDVGTKGMTDIDIASKNELSVVRHTAIVEVEGANEVDSTMIVDETKESAGYSNVEDSGSNHNQEKRMNGKNGDQRHNEVPPSSPRPSTPITIDNNVTENRLVTPDTKNILTRSGKSMKNDVTEKGKVKHISPVVHEVASPIQTDMTFEKVVRVLTQQFGWVKLKGGNSLSARFYYYVKAKHNAINDPSQLCKLCKVNLDYFKGDKNLKIWLRKEYGWVESKGNGKSKLKRSKKRNNETRASSLNPIQSRKKAKITTISSPQSSSRRRSGSVVDKPRKTIRKRDDFGTAWDILLHSHGWQKISAGPIISNSGYIYLHGKHKTNERISGAFCLKHLERKKDYFVEDEELKEYIHKKHKWVGPEGKEFHLSSTEGVGRTRGMSRDLKD